jgi:hypothetical protein
MDPQHVIILLTMGLLIWILGTVYFAYAGAAIMETTGKAYWVSFALSPVLSAVICIAILRWCRILSADWVSAMVLLALPGMLGEAVVLTNLGTFMPRLRATSGGKYGAFLFATYAVVLALAEFVSLRSTR